MAGLGRFIDLLAPPQNGGINPLMALGRGEKIQRTLLRGFVLPPLKA
jgi:hypothetical protein